MCRLKRTISCIILCALIVSLSGCGTENKSDDNAAIYGETIGGLDDNELFAIIETNAFHPVLLVTSQVYDDSMGNQAAITCDVYYIVDEKIKNIGQIKSFGTAYPIAYDKTGIYAASGHGMQCLEIDEKNGVIRLEEGNYELIGEDGKSTYMLEKCNEIKEITEKEYYTAFEKYSEAVIVSFSYGASDTVNVK